MNSLDDIYMNPSLIPKVDKGGNKIVHRLANAIPFDVRIAEHRQAISDAVRRAIDSGQSVARNTIGKRRHSRKRISDTKLMGMNMLYEEGARVASIAEMYDISESYCLNLIQRYRAEKGLVNLSRLNRGTVRNQNSGKPNKYLLQRALTKIKMEARRKEIEEEKATGVYQKKIAQRYRDKRGTYNRR